MLRGKEIRVRCALSKNIPRKSLQNCRSRGFAQGRLSASLGVCYFFRDDDFSWALESPTQNELSSRPKRSEVEGPAVLSTSQRMLNESTGLTFVIPSVAEGSAVLQAPSWKCFAKEYGCRLR